MREALAEFARAFLFPIIVPIFIPMVRIILSLLPGAGFLENRPHQEHTTPGKFLRG